ANTGLAASTRYYYVVRAVTGVGVSPNSPERSATTFVQPPTGVVANAISATQIHLSWNPVEGATRYTVYRGTASGGPYSSVAAVGTTSYTNGGLSPSSTYYYVVRATASAGISANSNQAFATTPALPSAPTNLVATAASSSVIN